jgi:valyl-tRNA synthetase
MLDKTFQPSEVEQAQYGRWEKSGSFAANPESNKDPFAIMIPPPNVTGSLHMGHALNMTLQDILTRHARMKGKDALWQPGTDHAGIATQMVVERQLDAQGKSRREMGREAFLDKVWEWKEHSGGTIVSQLRRLGATPDWERERFTMDEGLSEAVRKVFVQLYKEKLIYRDKRLVNWDPKLQTAISDLEVEQRESKGHMWHIRYQIEGTEERFITVATTRPETLLGDTAVAVHPDDERYKDLVGKTAIVPIANRPIPIVADEYADPEQGSGAVKITPAHDFNDFEVGKRHDLPMINLFDTTAHMNENAPEAYQGLDRFEARKKVLAELEELDQLVEVEDITNVVPYGDRGGVIIEPYLTDQWYVDAATLAAPALEAVKTGKTKFVPQQWENTYYAWLDNIQPWCISRQLWWGHRIPAWYGPNGSVFVAETEEEAQAQAREMFDEDVILRQDEDVLDTWFSSALWPFSTIGWPEKTKELDKYYPGDVLVTGFDIIFFWVARMMMMGIHFMGDVPFHTVYIHALVRDAKGQKMSKSKGNVIDPLELIDQYGADALRFTLTAMAAQGRDIKLSEERVTGYRNFGTKLWNATRYCEMNDCLPKSGASFDPAAVSYAPNKWIISELVKTTRAIDDTLAGFRFNESAAAVYHFVWGTFCDWYLEFTKPVLSAGGEAAEEVRATTGWVLNQILTILNPFMPYITEELYDQILPSEKDELLMNREWPDFDEALINADADAEMGWLTRFISEIRSVRADMNVPASAKIRLLVSGANDVTSARVQAYEEIIVRMARLETIAMTSEAEIPAGAIRTVVDEATLIMPIADIIDLDKERARLRKEIDKLSVDIKKIDQKLGNEKFLANAPDEVVEEQRSRKSEAEVTLEKLSEALKQLEAA